MDVKAFAFLPSYLIVFLAPSRAYIVTLLTTAWEYIENNEHEWRLKLMNWKLLVFQYLKKDIHKLKEID